MSWNKQTNMFLWLSLKKNLDILSMHLRAHTPKAIFNCDLPLNNSNYGYKN